jgi:hypothetical protein
MHDHEHEHENKNELKKNMNMNTGTEMEMDKDMYTDMDKDIFTSSLSHSQAKFAIGVWSQFRCYVPRKTAQWHKLIVGVQYYMVQPCTMQQ